VSGLRVRSVPGVHGASPGGQSVGDIRDESSVHDLLMSTAPPRVQAAGKRLDLAELAMMESDDEPVAMAYAAALTDWGDAGGYQAEVLWDACCTAALSVPYERCRWRDTSTLSGGEQKRLVLEALLRGLDEVLLLELAGSTLLLLDEPTRQPGSGERGGAAAGA
jgi:ATPase subunit of ABC transporter with duplicated ATPase domains